MNNKYLRFLVLTIFFLALPAMGIAATPRDCLIAIDDSLENGDDERFQKLVDLDGIISQALNVFVAEVQKPENTPYLPPIITLMFSQAANQEQIKRLLTQETRAFVLNGVSSGAFAGKQLASRQQQGILAPLFAHASTGRKEIRNLGEAMSAGDDWLMPFSIYDYGNEHDYPVIGRFGLQNGRLKLIGIENLEQIFTRIKKEMTQ